MNFLKNLFSGGGGSSGGGRFMTLYIRPKRCDQIVEVRIDLMNDISLNDEGNGYWVRKSAQAIRCPFAAEVIVYFSKNKRVQSVEVSDGEQVETEEYVAWQAEKSGERS